MMERQVGLCRIGILLIGMGLAALAAPPLRAQDTPQIVRVRVEAGKEPLTAVNLRPNSATAVGIILQNPTDEGLRNVVVKLVQTADGESRVIAQTEVAKIPVKGEARLVFPKAKDGAKESADKLELLGPPFKLQLWLESPQKDFAPIKRDLTLIVREPRDYITSVAQFDKNAKKLSFKLRVDQNESLVGPQQCPLQLVLGAGLEETKKGVFKQILTGSKQACELLAEDVGFAGTTLRETRAYLTVDGYDRAFTYPLTLIGSGDIDEVSFTKKIGARIRVPRFAKPSPKFPVSLELDGPLDGDYRVEVGLDRAGMKEQFQVMPLSGLRQQKAKFGFSAKGDLVCQTEVRDWQVEFDTTGIIGNIWFRVAVFKKDRKTGKYGQAELTFFEVASPQLATLEADADLKQVFARVTQDDTPPQDLEFVMLPKEWVVGKVLPVQAKARKREDSQAPIDKVVLDPGRLPADGKVSPDAVLGAGELDPKTGEWTIKVPPLDKVETLEITAQFTTFAGVQAAKTATIAIKESSGAITKIKGKVAHGTLGRPNLAVTLADAKGNVKDTQKTNGKGEFVFDKVAPGAYVVSATVAFPALVGRTMVLVPEGKELVDNVLVRLQAK